MTKAARKRTLKSNHPSKPDHILHRAEIQLILMPYLLQGRGQMFVRGHAIGRSHQPFKPQEEQA
jgi:hypothetical protein